MSEKASGGMPPPGTIFALLLAVGVGLWVLSFGLDQFGMVINRHTRAIFIILIAVGIGTAIFSNKSPPPPPPH